MKRAFLWSCLGLSGPGCTLLFGVFEPPACGDDIRDPGELCFRLEETADVTQPEAVVLGDLNQDGSLDAVVSNLPGSISVFLQNGEGQFAEPIEVLASPGTNALVLGDFDGDEVLDIATGDAFSGVSSVFLNLGAGTAFVRREVVVDASNWVDRGDFDGDGDLDLIHITEDNTDDGVDNDSFTVAVNDGAGNFLPSAPVDVGLGEQSVAVGDFDGDGDPDAVVALEAEDAVRVLRNVGGSLTPDADKITVGGGPVALSVADLEGDGTLEILVAETAGTVTVLFQGPGGELVPVSLVVGDSPRFVLGSDLNDDGFVDLSVAGGFGSDEVSVLLGDGLGSFGAPAVFETGQVPFWLAGGDIDQDGVQDLAITAANDQRLLLLRSDP